MKLVLTYFEFQVPWELMKNAFKERSINFAPESSYE